MSQDFSNIGLDSQLRKIGGFSSRYKYAGSVGVVPKQEEITGMDFDTKYEVQVKSVRISSLVNNSDLGVASGSFDNGNSVTVFSSYTNKNFGKNFALPYLAIYTGTAAVAGNQIYPRFGTAIANAKYAIHSGNDYHGWDGNSSSFKVNIENNSGTTSNVYAILRWKKLSFTSEVEELA